MKRLFLVIIFILSTTLNAAAQKADGCTAGNVDFYMDKAAQAVQKEQYDLALDYYGCAIELDSGRADAYEQRGAIYFQQQNFELALADYQRVVDEQPDNSEAVFRVAYCLQETGEFQAAVDTYTRYIELAPNDWAGYNNRAVGYVSMEQIDRALADYARAIELDTEDTLALENRANIYLDRGEYDLALDDINRALEIKVTPELYLTRAVIFELSNRATRAYADFWRWIDANKIEKIERSDYKIGTTVTLPMEEGRVYYIPLAGKFGQVFSVTAVGEAAEGESIDPLVVLLNSAGEAVAANDDGAGGLDSLIGGYAIPEDGKYTLVVSHAGGGFTGNINLTLNVDEGLEVGDSVMVQTTKDDFLNLRAGPGLDFEILERLPNGVYATTLEGPASADGYVWWRVSAAGDSVEGWIVLSADTERTLVRRSS